MGRSLNVLILTADDLTRRVCENGLAISGYNVVTAATGTQAVAHLDARKFDVLVTDAELGGDIGGLSVARLARARNPKIDVIYTAASPHRVADAHKVERAPCIRAPYSAYQVSGVIVAMRQRPGLDLPQAA